ncbi:MAG: hypothetical protein JWO75_2153, partial [Actinomycetia bacterium]|nr:hypothetical protein [Actinomycetes bacterium]
MARHWLPRRWIMSLMSVDLAAVCVFCGSNRGASPKYE